MSNKTDVLIIGGGIMGISSAYCLADLGCDVTVIDLGRDELASSYGNAGLVCPSHSVPLAAPGVMGEGLKWMFDPESPFYIRPRIDLNLFRWLMKFRSSANQKHVDRAVPLLRDLHLASRDLFSEWSDLLEVDSHYERRGLFYVYDSDKGLQSGLHEADLMREANIPSTVHLGSEAIGLVPELREGLAGVIHYPDDAHVDPARFVDGLAQRAVDKGVTLIHEVEAVGFETKDDQIIKVRTTLGDFMPEQVVLASGAWTPELATMLKLRAVIQPAKGYSITYARPAEAFSIPMLLVESRVAVTPMGPNLRLAGTLEMVGMDLGINERRLNAINKGAARYLNGVDSLDHIETWRGLRPCTPDGLPLLGRSERLNNLVFAAGHAMIGLSLGPVTGQVVARLVAGEDPGFDLNMTKPERFG